MSSLKALELCMLTLSEKEGKNARVDRFAGAFKKPRTSTIWLTLFDIWWVDLEDRIIRVCQHSSKPDFSILLRIHAIKLSHLHLCTHTYIHTYKRYLSHAKGSTLLTATSYDCVGGFHKLLRLEITVVQCTSASCKTSPTRYVHIVKQLFDWSGYVQDEWVTDPS